jgi:hypothetical protein
MTRSTRSSSTFADARRRGATIAVALAAFALLGAVATAGTVTAQSDRPTVVVTDGTTAPDGTTTVGVVLTSAPNGLSGYYLDVTVENPSVARIEAASYPDGFALTSSPAIDDDGATATLEAADMDGAIEPGATDVTLATVTVAGGQSGETTLAVEPRQFDADDGGVVDPAVRSGTVTVAGDDGASSADDATDADADDATDADADDARPTSGAGPLSPVLVAVAVGLLIAAGRRRRT